MTYNQTIEDLKSVLSNFQSNEYKISLSNDGALIVRNDDKITCTVSLTDNIGFKLWARLGEKDIQIQEDTEGYDVESYPELTNTTVLNTIHLVHLLEKNEVQIEVIVKRFRKAREYLVIPTRDGKRLIFNQWAFNNF